GLGLATPAPHFVTRIDADTRTVVVAPRARLERSGLVADDVHWLVEPPSHPVTVRIRHRGALHPASIQVEGDLTTVRFHEPVSSVAPGQAAVIYEGDR